MNYRQILPFITLVFLMSFLSKVFGMASTPNQPPLGATRTINIDGNILSFAMPENFSKDFPAYPINENPNTDELKNGVLLAQRWWDIREPGWFGKDLGTLMMRVNVHLIPENTQQLLTEQAFDVRRQIDFLLAITQHLKNTHPKPANPEHDDYYFTEFATMLGDKIHPAFDEKIFNSHKWISYVVTGPNGLLIQSYASALSMRDLFLEVSFEYAANDNVLPRSFNEVAYRDIASHILNTMTINLASQESSEAAMRWVSEPITDTYKNHESEIILQLFGNELRSIPNERLSPKLIKILGLPNNREVED